MMRLAHKLMLKLVDAVWVLAGLTIATLFWIGWIVKDQHPRLIWFSYLPAVVVAGVGFIWLFLTLRHRFRLAQLFMFATVIVCLFKVLVIDHRWHRPPDQLPAKNIRILHWNTARGMLGVESVMRTINDDVPDIVLISEPPRHDTMTNIAFYALGMKHVFSDAGMSVASHYPVAFVDNIILPAGAGWHVIIETPAGPLEFAAVDLVSRPRMDRRPTIEALVQWIDRRTNHLPLVIMGDFNIPHDATSLHPLRDRLNYAYEEHGRGWPYTWPVILPLYAIDHTWISHDVTVQDFRFKTAKFSDHKRQIADITFPNRRPGRAAKETQP